MYKFMRSKVGFTLVELLIVVVILGVLVAVGVPMYNSVTKNTRIKVCNVKQREITTDVKNWCTDNMFNDDYYFCITSDGEQGTLAGKNRAALSPDMITLLKDDVLGGSVPCCPGGGTIEITLEKNPTGRVKITVTCDGGSDGDTHKK